jgi:hypothetical protein
LGGKWKVAGPNIDGYVSCEWMEGGFFCIQHFDLTYNGVNMQGIEDTGCDEEP